MRSNLVPICVEVLHLAVVGPLVRDVKCAGDGAAVGVESALFEEVAEEFLVQVVDGIVKRQQDNLRRIIYAKAA